MITLYYYSYLSYCASSKLLLCFSQKTGASSRKAVSREKFGALTPLGAQKRAKLEGAEVVVPVDCARSMLIFGRDRRDSLDAGSVKAVLKEALFAVVECLAFPG